MDPELMPDARAVVRVRRWLAIGAATAVVSCAAGCGGSSTSNQGKTEAEKWADDVCSSISTWRDTVSQAKSTPRTVSSNVLTLRSAGWRSVDLAWETVSRHVEIDEQRSSAHFSVSVLPWLEVLEPPQPAAQETTAVAAQIASHRRTRPPARASGINSGSIGRSPRTAGPATLDAVARPCVIPTG